MQVPPGWLASERPILDCGVFGLPLSSFAGRASSAAADPRPGARNHSLPALADESEQTFELRAPIRRQEEYCRTYAGPAARILPLSPDAPTALSAPRGEAWVIGFDCGVGGVLLRALPHRPGGLVPI
jgi:hypothetical protein